METTTHGCKVKLKKQSQQTLQFSSVSSVLSVQFSQLFNKYFVAYAREA